MMTSKAYREAYVWIWLPGETTPVVAGKLTVQNKALVFNYGKSYLERENKISIYEPELPLRSGILDLSPDLDMPGSIRDGSPDAWGRRVLINKRFGATGSSIDSFQLDELTFLLESGSDRIGALDFQLSPTEYIPRVSHNASLDELIQFAERVEQGIPLTRELDYALHHGTPIGGARPKALIEERGRKKYIAKFSSTSDLYSVIKAEYIAMKLAKAVGINAAEVHLKKSSHREVLLIERFDRVYMEEGWQRRSMVSALTLFGLNEMMARYASYETLAEIIRKRFQDASATLRELYKRLVFNILCGNTDDHARNHAAFWDGKMLTLTPAYDICPQPRSGNEATQAMLIVGNKRLSQIRLCIEAAHHYLLDRPTAISIIENQVKTIIENWDKVCKSALTSPIDRKLFASRQFLNLFAFENLDPDCQHLEKMIVEFKNSEGSL